MSDINIGAITEALNDKTDRDMRNVDNTAGADAVIDFQLPTANNGYTWYRKYKSGWVEQGGIYDNGSSVQTKSANITLPITMADSNYTVIETPSRGTVVNTSTSMMTGIHSKTTTGFSITWLGVNSADTVQYASWYVCGIAA